MFGFLKKKEERPVRRQSSQPRQKSPLVEEKLVEISKETKVGTSLLNSIKEAINQLSSKQDIENVLKEIAVSREDILAAVDKVPADDDIAQLLVSQITEPLKEFLNARLGAIPDRPLVPITIRAREPVPLMKSEEHELEGIVSDMKTKLSMLSQRHMKIINILAQNRNLWVDYENIGEQCQPALTGSCIRGYISDLTKNYKLPIEKKNFGRQMKIRLSESAFKKMVMAKLVEV